MGRLHHTAFRRQEGKTQRHKGTKTPRKAASKVYFFAAFLGVFVPLCLCVLPSSGFKVIGGWWIEREVQCEPNRFGVPGEPNAKQDGDRDHDAKCESRGPDSEDVAQHGP